MIHNITEERNKLNRQDVSLSDPFTDEELLALIGQVEESALIHAPAHLKERVFFQLDDEKQKRKMRQLFSYRAKVLAGMAAALTVLFLVPVDDRKTIDLPWADQTDQGTADMDAWERDIMERQQDIDRTWMRYQEGQKRAETRTQYVWSIVETIEEKTDWED